MEKRMKKRFMMFASCVLAFSLNAGEWKDGLLFSAGFGTGVDAEIAGGAKRPQKDLPLVPGIHGNGVQVTPEAPLAYNNVANLDLKRGTIAFWFKPAPELLAEKKNWTLFRALHLTLAYTEFSKALFFMTGATVPQKGFLWDYSLATKEINHWKPGEWQHIAASWDREKGEKTLYLNGSPVKTTKTKRFPSRMGGAEPLLFPASGVYDEIMIWNRELSASEVFRLAKQPGNVSREILGSAKKNNLDGTVNAAALLKGRSFAVSFDRSAVPEYSNASSEVKKGSKTETRPGIINAGMSGTVFYDSRAVVEPEAGTVSFWFKPDRDFKELKQTIVFFRAGHISLNHVNGALFFMTGGTRNGTFSWDYGCGTNLSQKWKAGEWHHLAFSWNKKTGRKALYLDGKKIKGTSSDRFPDAVIPAGEFIFMQNAPGTADELNVWTRPLSDAEIIELCGNPAKIPEADGRKILSSVTGLPIQQAARRILNDAKSGKIALQAVIPDLSPEKTIVAPGESFEAKIILRNPSLLPVRGEIAVTLRDFHMKGSGTEKINVEIPAGGERILTRTFVPEKRGIYKVEVVYDNAGKKHIWDVASFGCWNLRQKPDPDSFFGNHVNSWANGVYLRQAAKLGLNWVRNHNMLQATWWCKAQPKPGEFSWEDDNQIELLKKLDMHVLGQLFTTPNWAAAGGPRPETKGYNQCFKPDLKLFAEYVRKMVNRHKNYIRYWEIWNEPDVSMFWKGTPEEFAELVQVAVKAIREADPTAKIMAAGYPNVARAWHLRAAKAGAFKNLDIISFHYYASSDKQPEELLPAIQDAVAHFQNLAVKYGDGKPLPIWDSEGGSGSTTFLRGGNHPLLAPEEKREPMNWKEAAVRIVQFEAILASEKIVRNFHYLQNRVPQTSSEAYNSLCTLDFNNAPKPLLLTRAAAQEQLDYHRFYERFRKPEARFWGFLYQHKTLPSRSVLLTWCGDEGKLELSGDFKGRIVEKTDLLGNKVSFQQNRIAVSDEPSYYQFALPAKEVAEILKKTKIRIEKAPVKWEETIAGDEGHKVPSLPDFTIPAEAPGKSFTIDLRKFCNMGLADQTAGDGKGGWADEGDMNDMRDLKTGRRTFYGVPFDLITPSENNGKAVITLKSRNLTPKMPGEVRRIPVGKKVRALYFLHSASWGSPGDIGSYTIHYADGSRDVVRMNIPLNNNNWWFSYDPREESRPIPVRVTNTMSGKPAWRYLRLFEWKNPKRGTIVKSIDISSACGHQTPIVLAISGVAE